MSDPRAKHWLADDANFLATLGDLDRGLGATSPGDDIPPPPTPRARVEWEEPRPRPLLDLFPEWALLPESAAPVVIPASPAHSPARDSPRLPRSPMIALGPEPAEVIDRAVIELAAVDLDLQSPAGEPGLLGRLLIVTVFALLVLVGAAGALWASRDAVNRTILQWEQMPLPPGGPVRRLSVPIAPIPPPDVPPDNLQRGPAI